MLKQKPPEYKRRIRINTEEAPAMDYYSPPPELFLLNISVLLWEFSAHQTGCELQMLSSLGLAADDSWLNLPTLDPGKDGRVRRQRSPSSAHRPDLLRFAPTPGFFFISPSHVSAWSQFTPWCVLWLLRRWPRRLVGLFTPSKTMWCTLRSTADGFLPTACPDEDVFIHL